MDQLDDLEFDKAMYLNAMRWKFFRSAITYSGRAQEQAQAAMAAVMRGEQDLTPELVDAAIDAAMASFGVRTKMEG